MTITNPERPKTLSTNWFYGFLIIIIVLGVLLRCANRQFKFEVQQVLMPQRILHEACDSQEIFLVDG